MKENNNRFEQKEASVNSKEVKKTREDVVWRITETLKNTSEKIVANEVGKEIAKTSNDLAELKDLIGETHVPKKGIKINFEAYDRRHDIDRMNLAFKNTSTEQILQRTHQQLKERRLDTRFLGSDFMV